MHEGDASGEEASSSGSSSAATEGGFEGLPLPLPSARYMEVLDSKAVKELRSRSNTMAGKGTLQRIICGQNGITQAFLNACADVLGAHEFLRVKLGEGAGLERKAAAAALARHLDAVSVHEIGFTITLYRRPGLPRPSNCPGGNGSVGSVNVVVPVSADADAPRVPKQRTSAKSAAAAAAGKLAAKATVKGPPEFTKS
ncbi:hypothetical protein FOA52_008455 [Chlamydomonas sp. UWO 241]|nr:hypothetical protein FOA52_008455 [Chlamydomonas sp. UWO 241]